MPMWRENGVTDNQRIREECWQWHCNRGHGVTPEYLEYIAIKQNGATG